MNVTATSLILLFIIPFLTIGQTISGVGGDLTPTGSTSGVVSYTATASGVQGSTLAGVTCANANIADITVPAILGYNTEITNVTLVNLTHTFAADLDIRLISPGGTTLTLNLDNGGSTGTDVVTNICFDVSSANCSDTWTSSTSASQPEDCLLFETEENTCGPLLSPFRFVCGTNMASIEGLIIDGTWTLEVTDDAGGDTGTFDSFSITFGAMTPPLVDSDGASIDLLECCATEQVAIPTMGEWGLISLTLLLMVFGVIAVRSKMMVLKL